MNIMMKVAIILIAPCCAFAGQPIDLSSTAAAVSGYDPSLGHHDENVIPYAIQAHSSKNRTAKDRLVRIFAQGSHATGETLPAEAISYILFINEPYQLPLHDTGGMHRAWMRFGAHQLGCWYPTIDEQFVFVGEVESLTQKFHAYWKTMPHAQLHVDGSATIIEPDYHGEEDALRKYIDQRNAHLNDYVNEKP